MRYRCLQCAKRIFPINWQYRRLVSIAMLHLWRHQRLSSLINLEQCYNYPVAFESNQFYEVKALHLSLHRGVNLQCKEWMIVQNSVHYFIEPSIVSSSLSTISKSFKPSTHLVRDASNYSLANDLDLIYHCVQQLEVNIKRQLKGVFVKWNYKLADRT